MTDDKANLTKPAKAIDAIKASVDDLNKLGARLIPLSRELLEKHFHAEVTSLINNEMKVVGIEAFYQRFVEMQEKTEHWEVTPHDISLSEDNKAAGRYQYRFTDKQGLKGVIDIIAIWELRDGKLFRMIEHGLFSGSDIALASYAD